MKTYIGLAALGVLVLASVPASGPAEAAPMSLRTFCRTWLKVCDRTGDPDVCGARYSRCLATRCFRFHVPHPRCMDNPADMTVTRRVR